MMKVFRLFLYFFFIQIKSQQHPLYCFENELDLLLSNSQVLLQNSQQDKNRFENLEQKKEFLFWHLNDPITGMQSCQKLEQPLSWNFSLWNLAPQRGRKSKIAIVDSGCDFDFAKLKHFCRNCLKSLGACDFDRAYYLVEKNKNVSPCGQCKNEFFLYFLKNISNVHGMLTRNIIYQFAPDVNITAYNIFDDYGYSNNQKLLESLETISGQSFDIIHLGCKITSQKLSLKYQKKLDSQLKKMNYIVAASGNDRAMQKEEAYPAKNQHVCLDVGAFSLNRNDNYRICPFSQFEVNIGPKVIAPGSDIFCPITNKDELLGFVMLSGTSMAAAIVSGLLALVVSEFKEDFSYKQILTVLYICTKKLGDSSDWQERVLLGALDIRSALFCLHVLRKIKKTMSIKNFLKLYESLVCEVFFINNLPVSLTFENKQFVEKIFQDFIQKGSLEKAISHTAEVVLMLYHNATKNIYFKKLFDKKLVSLLRTIKYKILSAQVSLLKHEKIQFALNRKE